MNRDRWLPFVFQCPNHYALMPLDFLIIQTGCNASNSSQRREAYMWPEFLEKK